MIFKIENDATLLGDLALNQILDFAKTIIYFNLGEDNSLIFKGVFKGKNIMQPGTSVPLTF